MKLLKNLACDIVDHYVKNYGKIQLVADKLIISNAADGGGAVATVNIYIDGKPLSAIEIKK